MREATITVRDVFRLLLAPDRYRRLCNHDCREADWLEADAPEKARSAVPCPDDPPEFGRWFEALLKPGLHDPEREEIYYGVRDFFDESDCDISLDLGPAGRR